MNSLLKTTLLFTIITILFSDVKAYPPQGLEVFLNGNSGKIKYELVLEYKDFGGGTFERTIRDTKHLSSHSFIIPAAFKGSPNGNPYAPTLKRALFDLGRDAHGCGYSEVNYDGARLARPGETNWKICLTDLYRSRSSWRKTCKDDGRVDVVAHDGNGGVLVPTGNRRGRFCAKPLKKY